MTGMPLDQLNRLSKLYPGAWRGVELFRRDKGKDLDWPAFCFLPMAGWYSIVSAAHRVDRLTLEQIGDVAKLAALGTWRYSQGIYRYDDSMAAALGKTALSGELPVEVLLRLPEWCVYVETPGRHWLDSELLGFWAHLEWDVNTQRRELRFLLNVADGRLIPQILHIGPWTITEAIDRWFSEARNQYDRSRTRGAAIPDRETSTALIQQLGESINPLLSMLLYLCSDEPDIGNRDYPQEKPGRPKPKRTKKGWRLFPPPKPKIWQVGDFVGETLRQAEQSIATGRSVRAHLRKAHWHGFWHGPKSAERRFRYKWLPPIVVGGSSDE